MQNTKILSFWTCNWWRITISSTTLITMRRAEPMLRGKELYPKDTGITKTTGWYKMALFTQCYLMAHVNIKAKECSTSLSRKNVTLIKAKGDLQAGIKWWNQSGLASVTLLKKKNIHKKPSDIVTMPLSTTGNHTFTPQTIWKEDECDSFSVKIKLF